MAEKSLKKNALYSIIKEFMNLAFPVITFPYASRILLPEGIGKVNFANSIVSPAMEYKSEGYVMGVGGKMFTVAGPVLVFGISASIIVGIIYMIFNTQSITLV